jgi:NAD(P)-dependent dehydrogenase (short-subunit alcohol dehydrogenase family)
MAILITGASGGLGKAVVDAFLATGATVYGANRSWKDQPHSNPRFHPIEANLTDAAECDRVAKLAGPVDALLHLIGGFDGGKSVAETPDETWDKMLELNLRSAQMIFRAVLPSMKKAGKGRIVAVSSRAAVEPMANFAAYSVSKAALVALVKTVALEVKDSGITANVVLPSVIDTSANRAAMPSADVSKWVTPDSIAGLLVWLASDAARDVNGAAIPIYGRA